MRNKQYFPTIKIIGLGRVGCNAINAMIDSHITGVEFIAVNSYSQELQNSLAPTKLLLRPRIKIGLGYSPEIARSAALENAEKIREILKGSDVVFIIAGLGGSTGTGGATVVVQIAKDLGALTLAIVTMPFDFEGRVRMKRAENGAEELVKVVDTLIILPNQQVLKGRICNTTTLLDQFKVSDEFVYRTVKAITDAVASMGLQNSDFIDMPEIVTRMKAALISDGIGRGENRAVVEEAISNIVVKIFQSKTPVEF